MVMMMTARTKTFPTLKFLLLSLPLLLLRLLDCSPLQLAVHDVFSLPSYSSPRRKNLLLVSFVFWHLTKFPNLRRIAIVVDGKGTAITTPFGGDLNEGTSSLSLPLIFWYIIIRRISRPQLSELTDTFPALTIQIPASVHAFILSHICLLYTSPSPRD